MADRRYHSATGRRRGRPKGSTDSAPRTRRTAAEIKAHAERQTLQEVCYESILDVDGEEDVGALATGETMIDRILSYTNHVHYLGDVCKLVKTICAFGEFTPGGRFEELVDWVRGVDFLNGPWSLGEDPDISSEVLLLQEVAATETKRKRWLSEYDMAMRQARIFRPIDVSLLPNLWPCLVEQGDAVTPKDNHEVR